MVQLLPQIAIADAACIVAPLAVDPAHAGRAASGVLPARRRPPSSCGG